MLNDKPPAADLADILRKIIWRLMPFLLVAMMINAIDRLNISFAKLRMVQDIALSDAAYGVAAGVFFLGIAEAGRWRSAASRTSSRSIDGFCCPVLSDLGGKSGTHRRGAIGPKSIFIRAS